MRKKIGVIICEAIGNYQKQLLTGINNRAHILGYDVLVFATFVKLCYHENYEYGQKNIFKLINFDLLDGVIVAGDTLQVRGLKEELFPRLQNECRCPVIFIDYMNDMGFTNVLTDDTTAFEEIVDHLIDIHHCRNILFYSGPYEVASSQSRYEGYQNSLRKHGMPLNPDFVSFDGDFWTPSGETVAKEILEGKRQRPDAIAFCGDYMAIAAQKIFQEAGLRIPEDIIITGFDATLSALQCNPPITSYSPAVYTAGENAVTALDAQITNSSPTWQASFRGKLEIGGSCGCEEDFTYTKRFYYRTEASFNYEQFLCSSMMEDLAEAENFLSLLYKIDFFLYLIPHWKEFHLCLCDNLFYYDSPQVADNCITDGYTDRMVHYIKSYENNHRIIQDTFDSKQMLPTLNEERPEPSTYYFIPIHMNRKCFGYSVLSYGNENRTFDTNYMNWTKHICNALEYYRIQAKVSSMALFDALTGVHTRAGIHHKINLLLNHMNDDEYRVMVVVTDLDNLKTINDTLGHQAGDQAIHTFSRILLSVIDERELCARIGGDEFVLLGCNNYSDDRIQTLIKQIKEKLDETNRSGQLPFRLSASIGGVLRKISTVKEIESLYHEADQHMYYMKKRYHEEG